MRGHGNTKVGPLAPSGAAPNSIPPNDKPSTAAGAPGAGKTDDPKFKIEYKDPNAGAPAPDGSYSPWLAGGLGATALGGLGYLLTPAKAGRLRMLAALLGAVGGGVGGALLARSHNKGLATPAAPAPIGPVDNPDDPARKAGVK